MLSLSLGFSFRLAGNRLPTDGSSTLDLNFVGQVESATLDADFTVENYRVRPDDIGGVAGIYTVWS